MRLNPRSIPDSRWFLRTTMTLQPYIFPIPQSPQVKVVLEYLEALAVFDTDRLSRLTTDNFVQTTSPVSIGQADRSKAEDLAFLKQLQASLKGQTLTFTVYNVNDSPGKTWVHAKIETLGLEVLYLFQFGQGPFAFKVASVREFVDSATYATINSAPPASAPAVAPATSSVILPA